MIWHSLYVPMDHLERTFQSPGHSHIIFPVLNMTTLLSIVAFHFPVLHGSESCDVKGKRVR